MIAAAAKELLSAFSAPAPTSAAGVESLVSRVRVPRAHYERALGRRGLYDDVLPRTAELNALFTHFEAGTRQLITPGGDSSYGRTCGS